MATINKTLQYAGDMELISKNDKLYVVPIPIEGKTLSDVIANLSKNHGDGIYIIRFKKPDGKKVERKVKVEGHDVINIPRTRKKKMTTQDNPVTKVNENINSQDDSMSAMTEAFKTFGQMVKDGMERERDLNNKLIDVLTTGKSPNQPTTVGEMEQVYNFQKQIKDDALESLPERENPELTNGFTIDHGIKLIDMFMNRLDKRNGNGNFGQQSNPTPAPYNKIKVLEDKINRLSNVLDQVVDKIAPESKNDDN